MTLSRWIVGICASFLAACSQQPPPPPPPPPPVGWVVGVGLGTITPAGVLTIRECAQGGSTGYVWKTSGPLAVGTTLTMRYTVSGSGEYKAPGDELPATVSLFLQRAGDEKMLGTGAAEWWRLWAARTILKPGSTTVSQALKPDFWTGTSGRLATPTQFADTLRNLVHVGFTLGGKNFAGHGICAIGYAQLVVNDYVVQ